MPDDRPRRTLFQMLRRFFLVAGLSALGLTAVFILRFVPIIPSAPSALPSSLAEAQRLDLAYLRRLPRYDRSLRDPPVRAAFEHFVDSLAGAGPWSAAEFELLVARAAAIADNGHSNVTAAARRRRLGDDLPIRLARFAEGLFIVQATDEHRSLLGARLDAVGDLRVEDLRKRLTAYYGGPASRARYQAHLDLTSPSLLHALGATDDPAVVPLAVTRRDGDPDSLTLHALPPRSDRRRPVGRAAYLHEELDRDAEEVWRSLGVEVTPPLPLRDPGTRFAIDRIAGGAGAYLRIDGNENAPGERVKAFAGRALDSVAVWRPTFTVVDLRHNAGGTTALARFARRLTALLEPEGRVYVVVSGGTFSYGIATAALLRKYGGGRTILVGEPLGDRLRFWANGGSTFRLPHSGITLRAWSGLENYVQGCWSWRQCFWLSPFFLRSGIGALEVDLPVAPSIADYLHGRDSALEQILATEATRR